MEPGSDRFMSAKARKRGHRITDAKWSIDALAQLNGRNGISLMSAGTLQNAKSYLGSSFYIDREQLN